MNLIYFILSLLWEFSKDSTEEWWTKNAEYIQQLRIFVCFMIGAYFLCTLLNCWLYIYFLKMGMNFTKVLG